MYSFFSNLKKCVEEITESSSTDSHISQYILSNHEEIPNMSIFELAKCCNTSPSTITRFCQRINHSSFKQLKEDVTTYNEFLKNEVDNKCGDYEKINNNKNDILSNYFDVLNKSLYETQNLIDEKNLIKSVKLINRASSVYVFGSSFSNIIAKNISEKFTRLDKVSYSFPTLSGQIFALENMGENDIAIIVSFSKETRHIKIISKLLRKKKIPIIWITSSNKENIKPREVALLISPLKIDYFGSSIIQDHSLNMVVDILYIYYAHLIDK